LGLILPRLLVGLLALLRCALLRLGLPASAMLRVRRLVLWLGPLLRTRRGAVGILSVGFWLLFVGVGKSHSGCAEQQRGREQKPGWVSKAHIEIQQTQFKKGSNSFSVIKTGVVARVSLRGSENRSGSSWLKFVTGPLTLTG
jgi:hypothetical protein